MFVSGIAIPFFYLLFRTLFLIKTLIPSTTKKRLPKATVLKKASLITYRIIYQNEQNLISYLEESFLLLPYQS